MFLTPGKTVTFIYSFLLLSVETHFIENKCNV